MPRKPQPLSGRAARCAPHPALSLPPVARSPGCGASVAGRPAQRLPLSVSPTEWSPGVACGGWWADVVPGCPACGAGRSARASNACEGGRGAPWSAVPARPGRGWGGLRNCGCCAVAVAVAVLSRSRLLSRSWRTERARPVAPEGSRRDRHYLRGQCGERRYPAQRPRAAVGFLGVCGAVESKPVSPV